MNIFQTLILSVIEGLTEFLPISSTGHLILAAKILSVAQSDFTKSFEISIQSGAILAALFLYWKVLAFDYETLKRVVWSFVPTGLVGLLAYKAVKGTFLGNINITLISLVIGGIIIILAEKYFKTHKGKLKVKEMPLPKSVLLGFIQAIAVIPGVSRAGATIIGGEFLGLDRSSAVGFSFMLAIPTLLAATGYDLLKNLNQFNLDEVGILMLGFVASFIVAYLTIKWFIGFVKSSDLTGFGIYRIVIALIFFLIK